MSDDDITFRENDKRISFAFQNLSTIPSKILRRHYRLNLEELDLTENFIEDFRFLLELPYLKTLILDKNELKSHVKFPRCISLHTLWLNQNDIDNLGVIISTLATSFPNLQYLSLLNNPCAPSYFNGGSFTQHVDYRFFVISHLPSLTMLDSQPVNFGERAEAERIYGKHKRGMNLEKSLDFGQKRKHKKKKSPQKSSTNIEVEERKIEVLNEEIPSTPDIDDENPPRKTHAHFTDLPDLISLKEHSKFRASPDIEKLLKMQNETKNIVIEDRRFSDIPEEPEYRTSDSDTSFIRRHYDNPKLDKSIMKLTYVDVHMSNSDSDDEASDKDYDDEFNLVRQSKLKLPAVRDLENLQVLPTIEEMTASENKLLNLPDLPEVK